MTINNAINANGGLPITVANGGTGLTSITAHGIVLGQGASNVSALSLTDGQIAIGSTGNDPSAATLTAGTGISITNGAGSISIAATGAFTWNTVSGTSQAMSASNGYFANNASLVTLTLPSTASVGATFEVVAKGAGLFQIAQNSGQTIKFGNTITTSGTGGYIQATAQGDTIKIVCMTTDTGFIVTSSIGNLTVN